MIGKAVDDPELPEHRFAVGRGGVGVCEASQPLSPDIGLANAPKGQRWPSLLKTNKDALLIIISAGTEVSQSRFFLQLHSPVAQIYLGAHDRLPIALINSMYR